LPATDLPALFANPVSFERGIIDLDSLLSEEN
jgi:hypothetical protein